MRQYQLVLGVATLAFVGLWLVRSLDCAPKYYLRADVLAGLALFVASAVTLFYAGSGDGSAHRLAGLTASATLVGLLFQPGSTIVGVPFAIAGALRLPHGRRDILLAAALAALAVLAGHGLPLEAQRLMTPQQFTCP